MNGLARLLIISSCVLALANLAHAQTSICDECEVREVCEEVCDCPTEEPRQFCRISDPFCLDSAGEIVEPVHSCFNRCGADDTDLGYECSCDANCSAKGRCCDDFKLQCSSQPARAFAEPLDECDKQGNCFGDLYPEDATLFQSAQTEETTTTTQATTTEASQVVAATGTAATAAPVVVGTASSFTASAGAGLLAFDPTDPELQWGNLCQGLYNHAPDATASLLGGVDDSTGYGPSEMNDGDGCQFAWANNWNTTFQYQWDDFVNIRRFVIVTDTSENSCAPSDHCDPAHSWGRGIKNGTVEWYDGSDWITHGSFESTGSSVEYEFDECVYTNGLRIVGVHTHDCWQWWSPLIYEWSVCDCVLDDMCGSHANVAPFATPTGWSNDVAELNEEGGSGGMDSRGFGPSELNDRYPCSWYWPEGNSTGIEYEWAAPVKIDSFHLLTDEDCEAHTQCKSHSAGRGINSGVVEYWSAELQEWVFDGSFNNSAPFSSREIVYNLTAGCVVTDRLRINEMTTHPCDLSYSPIIYEWSVCSCCN